MLPPAVANEVLYAGRRLDAAEGLRWGLVNAVIDAADDLVAEVPARWPPESWRPLRCRWLPSARSAIAPSTCTLTEAFELLRSGDLDAYEAMLVSEDATEGPRAFTEGRAPRWQGR